METNQIIQTIQAQSFRPADRTEEKEGNRRDSSPTKRRHRIEDILRTMGNLMVMPIQKLFAATLAPVKAATQKAAQLAPLLFQPKGAIKGDGVSFSKKDGTLAPEAGIQIGSMVAHTAIKV